MVTQIAEESSDTATLPPVERLPALMQDVGNWARLHPESTRLRSTAVMPRIVECGIFSVCLGDARPDWVLDRLAELKPGHTCLHLFGDLAGFLLFITRAGAAQCIEHDGWMPILPLPLAAATHTQNWLLALPPSQWPWDLAKLTGESADPAPQHLVAQLPLMLGHRMRLLSAELARQYAGRPTPAEVLRSKARALRVLVFSSTATVYQQYCARDMTDGLTAHGIEARLQLEPGLQTYNHAMFQALREFDPDVLLLNGSGRLDVPMPAELCVVSWDQDYVLCNNDGYRKNFGPRDRLMVMVADWQTDAAIAGVPARRTAHVNLGTNVNIYHPSATARQPEFDILFVGNIHPFDVYRKLIHFDAMEPALQRLMLHARAMLDTWVRSRGQAEEFILPDCGQLLSQAMTELGIAFTDNPTAWRGIVHYFRYRIAHYVLRHAVLQSLTQFNLGLFGRGWENFPALAPFARGPLENGPPLRDAIHISAINLHLHSWTVHHPRLYDTAAAGGFLLVGRVPEQYPLENVFHCSGSAEAELDTFGSITELQRKVRHYLAHPQERAAIAGRAAQRARRDHAMERRMEQLVGLLAEDSDDR